MGGRLIPPTCLLLLRTRGGQNGGMQLSPEDINEFKAIYRKEYGLELSDADAEEKAQHLLRLIRAIVSGLSRKPKHSSTIKPNLTNTPNEKYID